ncbi:MAG: HPP family protein [Actinomycetota bacterium]|nr:HPP family protein [Actinomycetota bacterium]
MSGKPLPATAAAVLAGVRQGWNAHLVVVPVVLTLVELVSIQTELRLLLFPSLASFAYLLFTRPVGTHATWRGAVLGPTVGAAIGSLGALVFQSRILGVLVVTFVTMLMMRMLQVTNAPVLAVSILPLVFQTQGLDFPLSIFLATAGLFAFFLLWRRMLPPRVVESLGAPEADGTPQWRVAGFKPGSKKQRG